MEEKKQSADAFNQGIQKPLDEIPLNCNRKTSVGQHGHTLPSVVNSVWPSAHTCCGQHIAQPFMGRGVVQHPNLQTRTGRRCLWWLRLKLNVTYFFSPKNPLLETSGGGCHIGYETWIEIEPGAFQPALRQRRLRGHMFYIVPPKF